MPRAGPDHEARTKAHLQWAERYHKRGDTQKALSHFGRALEYDAMRQEFGTPDSLIEAAGVLGAPIISGLAKAAGSLVSRAQGPSPSEVSRAGSSRLTAAEHQKEHIERANAAREATAYAHNLGAANQLRFLMRMRLYHAAATIVGSTSAEDVEASAKLLGIKLPWTSPVTLFRNIMVQTEELSNYVAANANTEAVRMLDKDPMTGNGGWSIVGGAGEYVDGASEALREKMPPVVTEIFPALRRDKHGGLGPNGAFDGCGGTQDRCNKLASLYDSYAQTTDDADSVLLASLDRERFSSRGEKRTLIDRTISDVAHGKKDMLRVVIAAFADRDESYIHAAVRYLVMYYHARIRSIAREKVDDLLIAAVQYLEEHVKAAMTDTLGRAAHIASMMSDTLGELEWLQRLGTQIDTSPVGRKLLARTWVDRTYGLNHEYEGDVKTEHGKLYDAAKVLIEGVDFTRMKPNHIAELARKTLDDDKKRKEDEEKAERKRKEDEEKEKKRREAEREAREAQILIDAQKKARILMGIELSTPVGIASEYAKQRELNALKAAIASKYKTKQEFKAAFRSAFRQAHPDKVPNDATSDEKLLAKLTSEALSDMNDLTGGLP